MAQALCARQLACRPAYFEMAYLDQAMCEARNAISCALDVEAVDSAWSEATALECAASLPGVDCGLVFYGAGPACTPAAGARPDGSGCALDSQCQSVRCFRDDEQTCGICAPASVVGEPCDHKPESCDPWAHVLCGVNDTCEAPGTSGGPCSPSGYCVDGTVCDPATDTCVAGTLLGGSCSEIPCFDPSAYTLCDAATETCVAFPVVGHGESCQSALCAAAARCVAPPLVCVPLPFEGEPCDSVCVPPAVCGDDETCLLVHGHDCAP
jgi:hypothetical protein